MMNTLTGEAGKLVGHDFMIEDGSFPKLMI